MINQNKVGREILDNVISSLGMTMDYKSTTLMKEPEKVWSSCYRGFFLLLFLGCVCVCVCVCVWCFLFDFSSLEKGEIESHYNNSDQVCISLV
jgi:hypothetical protein